MRRVAASLALTGLFTVSGAAGADNWKAWESEIHKQCPSHHVEWLYGDAYIDLIEEFGGTLHGKTQARALKLTDHATYCSTETMGFYCDMNVNIGAHKKLGLLPKFVAFACRRYRCEAAALCKGIGASANRHEGN